MAALLEKHTARQDAFRTLIETPMKTARRSWSTSCAATRWWRTTTDGFDPSTLHRWTLDTTSAKVAEATPDEGSNGVGNKAIDASAPEDSGQGPGEAVFPAHHDAGEDLGWLVCFFYDGASDRSRFIIVDAAMPEGRPVASVPLPQRVPLGFHGNWIAS